MNSRVITILCLVFFFIFSIIFTMISPLIGYIAQDFSMKASQAGVIFTFNFIGFVIFTLFGGVLTDRFGKKKMFFFCLIGLTASLVAFPLTHSFFIACLVMAFIGGFSGILETLASAWINEVNTEKQEFYINMIGVSFGLGALIGPISIGYMVSGGLNWHLCFYALSISTALLAIAFNFIKYEETSEGSQITKAGLMKLSKDKGFLLIVLSMVLYTGSEVSSWGWLCTFLTENMKFSPVKSSAALGLFWSAMTIGRLTGGFLTERFHSRDIIVVLAALATICTAFAGFAASEAMAWIMIALMGLTFSAQWSLILALGGQYHKDLSNLVFAILIAFGGLGGMIIPYMMSIVAQSFGMRAAISSPALFFAVIALIYFRMGKNTQEAGCFFNEGR